MVKSQNQSKIICSICERSTPENCIEKHHTIPKSRGGKETKMVCCSCGEMIHQLISLKELKITYNSIKALKSHPDMKTWIKWISKKPNDFSVCMSRKKRRK